MGLTLAYKDIVKSEIAIEHHTAVKKAHAVGERYSNDAEHTLLVDIDFDFSVKIYTYEFFSMEDVISRIGGISSTIKVLIAIMGPIFAFKFMFIFARVLKRKA